jgi:hypothetical protein
MPKGVNSARWVYFIAAGDSGAVKIGCAECALTRVGSLQSSNHLELKLLLAVEHRFARSLEKKLHSRFADRRIRGEWYWLDGPVREAVAEFTSDRADVFAEHGCTGRYFWQDRFHQTKIPKQLIENPPMTREAIAQFRNDKTPARYASIAYRFAENRNEVQNGRGI